MFDLRLCSDPKSIKRVLCLGAHSDDLEIGCGATIARLVEESPGVSIHWVVFGAEGVRAEEAKNSAETLLSGVQHRVVIHAFRNSFFPYSYAEIKECFEALKAEVDPDLVFTHHVEDLHQDHRIVGELTWNTYRDHWILEYEIPKYDGGLRSPNVFVPIPVDAALHKCEHVVRHFESQLARQWFGKETFLALARLRGVECNAPSGYAEGFHCRKMTVQL